MFGVFNINMSTMFFEKDKLPKRLSGKELNELFTSYKNGNFEARQKIIEHNLYLVPYCIENYFNDVNHDKISLFECGVLGLIYAIDHYDLDYGSDFSLFVVRGICRSIHILLRDENKFSKEISLDSNFDTISNTEDLDADFTEQYYDFCSIQEIMEGMGYLNEKEREIINLYFGLGENKKHTIMELGAKYGVTKQAISLIIKKAITKIKNHVNACDEIKSNKRNKI